MMSSSSSTKTRVPGVYRHLIEKPWRRGAETHVRPLAERPRLLAPSVSTPVVAPSPTSVWRYSDDVLPPPPQGCAATASARAWTVADDGQLTTSPELALCKASLRFLSARLCESGERGAAAASSPACDAATGGAHGGAVSPHNVLDRADDARRRLPSLPWHRSGRNPGYYYA